jgi:hypothetical protein
MMGFFLFATASKPALWPTQTSYPMGTGCFLPLGREADHSPTPTAEVKNAWGYASTPQYVKALCLINKGYFFMSWY